MRRGEGLSNDWKTDVVIPLVLPGLCDGMEDL